MKEGMGMSKPEQRLLTAIEKVWIFGQSFVAITRRLVIFYKKRTLASRERETLQTRYTLWSTVSSDTLPSAERDSPVQLPGRVGFWALEQFGFIEVPVPIQESE